MDRQKNLAKKIDNHLEDGYRKEVNIASDVVSIHCILYYTHENRNANNRILV